MTIEYPQASISEVCTRFTDLGIEIKPAYRFAGGRPLPNWLNNEGRAIPGIYYGLPNDSYHKIEGLSSSMLKTFVLDSEAHYDAKYNKPDIYHLNQDEKRPDHFTAGDLIHALILEPWSVLKRYYRDHTKSEFPGALVTDPQIKAALKEAGEPQTIGGEKKADRIARLMDINPDTVVWDWELQKLADANEGKTAIKGGIWDCAHLAYKAFLERQEATDWIDHANGLSELSIIAECPHTGMIVRCRPDFTLLLPVMDNLRYPPLMVDVKSANSASPEKFARSIGDFGYHLQQAFYEYVFKLATGTAPFDFGFVVAEFEKASIVETIKIDKATMKLTRASLIPALKKLKHCYDVNQWAGYTSGGVTELSVAPWALKRLPVDMTELEAVA